MIIYKDIISGDELFTDASKIIRNKGMIEIETVKVSEDSGGIDDSLIGGNASAEEASEGTESSSKTGYDVVLRNRLAEMPPFDKKGYISTMKSYLKAIKEKMKEKGKSDEAIATFQTQMAEHVKRFAKNIDKMEVFCGESMNADGMQVLVDYRDDGVTAYASFVEEGLEEEKA